MLKATLEWVYNYLLGQPTSSKGGTVEIWTINSQDVDGIVEGVKFTGLPLPDTLDAKVDTIKSICDPTPEELELQRQRQKERDEWIANNQMLTPLTEESLKYRSFGPKWDLDPEKSPW